MLRRIAGLALSGLFLAGPLSFIPPSMAGTGATDDLSVSEPAKGDTLPFDKLAPFSELSQVLPLVHYLYFPSREAAAAAASALTSRGFETQHRLAADDVKWLVLAQHQAVVTQDMIDSVSHSMEILATEFGGEYDGWEAAPRIKRPPPSNP